ncbi:tetratricopeptide repeat protein [Sporolactobacillus sp. THM7-4]|nr:tetratricopeptide repeat protein [Sporolactobacillus sp. THM7-4]
MENLETANALMASGQTDDGLKLLRDLIRDADDDTIYGAALIYQKYGFLDDAEKNYEALLKRYPNDSGLLLQLSELLIDKDEENRAIEYLLKIHPLDENYLSAQVALADLYQLEGLDEVAEKKLLDALKIAPHEPVLLYALGEFYLSTGEAHQAVELFKEVQGNKELADQNIDLKLAEALSLEGEFEQSLSEYRKGLKKEKTLDGLFGYGVTASRIGQNKTTIKALEELKKLDPGYSTLYPVLAHAYEHEGDLQSALKTIEAGLSEDEFNERLYAEAGDLAVRAHDPDKAVYYYQKLFDSDPENIEALTKLVELKAQEEDYEGIKELLEGQDPDDPMLIWFLATAYNKTDDLKKAEKYYLDAWPAFADNPEFLEEYGEYLREIGKTGESLEILQKAAKLDPDNHDLILFVERLKQDYQR